MDKTLVGLIAAIGAAAPLASAHAAVTPEQAQSALRASSIAELLDSTPNATAVLAALDAERSQTAPAKKGVQIAQWHHHHHWHHHHWHHHHHHHYYYHHHHHHHYGYGPGCWRTPVGWVCP